MSILFRPYFHDEETAYAKVEGIVWPNGPICPHCGNVDESRIYTLKGKSHRVGLRKCAECRKQFTCKIGTIFESSRVPLHKRLQAIHLMVSSKKGISSNQLHRTLEVTLKTAWFMIHRIREAMRFGDLSPMGSDGRAVEFDETFIGHDKTKKPRGQKKGRSYHHKFKILTLFERKTRRARSIHVEDVSSRTRAPIVCENLSREAHMMPDEASYYTKVQHEFASHGIVHHNKGEYGRGKTHTNTIEGFFSIFKRGMKGVYQNWSRRHLHRNLAMFDFRYNERKIADYERADRMLAGIVGRRLMYRDSSAW